MMNDSNAKVGFVSLGCPKALVDSERILTQLSIDGYEIVQHYESADVVVVNTCGFINSARDESLDTIGEAIAKNGKVIVTGCLGVHKEEIEKAFELDGWSYICLDIITSLEKHNLSNDALGQLMMDVFELGAKEGKKRLIKSIERL